MDPKEKHELDNRSNQMNPNNDAYWQSRGFDQKPLNYSSGDDSYYDEDDYHDEDYDDFADIAPCCDWED